MSVTDSEARSPCSPGQESCEDCSRYLDDCSGKEKND